LQISGNGHNWLAAKLRRLQIGYKLVHNAFVEIADWRRSSWQTDWKSNACTANWISLPRPTSRSTVTLECTTTGAPTNAVQMRVHSVRVRYRRGVQAASGSGGDLRHIDPQGGSLEKLPR
jgi:hypothetical protein